MEPDRDPEVYKREIEVRSPEEDISEALRSEAAGPNRVGSSEDVSGLGQGPEIQDDTEVFLNFQGASDNVSEAGSLVPDWYKEQREEERKNLNVLSRQVQGLQNQVQTQIETQLKGVEGLISGQFQQLLGTLQGQFAEQAALKSRMEEQEEKMNQNQQAWRGIQLDVAEIHQELASLHEERKGQLTPSTDERLNMMEEQAEQRQQALQAQHEEFAARMELKLQESVEKEMGKRFPAGVATNLARDEGQLGNGSVRAVHTGPSWAAPYPGAATKEITEPAPSMEPVCENATPAFVTKGRGTTAPYGFSEDQQGFSELGRLMQGRKGMIAARMPAAADEHSPQQGISGHPSIVKQLSYQEAASLMTKSGQDKEWKRASNAPGNSSENERLMESSTQHTVSGGSRGPTPVSSAQTLNVNAPPWGPFTPQGQPGAATGGPQGAQASYPSPYVPYPPAGYPYPFCSPVPAVQTAKKNRNPGITLMKFSGKESLQDFILQIENAARIGDWDEEHKGGRLYGQLVGSALRVANSLPDGLKNDFESVKRALHERFEGDLERDRCREALRACKRRKNESLLELSHRIVELARKAFPPEQRDEEGVVAFRNALPEDLGRTLVADRPKTVDEAVDRVASLEVYLENTRQEKRHIIRAVQEEPASRASHGSSSGTLYQMGSAGKSGKSSEGGNRGNSNTGGPSQQAVKPVPPESPCSLTPQQMETLCRHITSLVQPALVPAQTSLPWQTRVNLKGNDRPYAEPGPDYRRYHEKKHGTNYGTGSKEGNGEHYVKRPVVCYGCGKEGHYKFQCPENDKRTEARRYNQSGNGPQSSSGPDARLNH